MRLDISLEPKWYDLIPEAGIRVLADPAVTDIMDTARDDERLKDLAGDEALPEVLEPGKASKLARILSLVVAEQVIRDWEGVEDEAGTKAQLTPDHIAAFLRHPQVADAWLLYYMQHWLQVGETITSEKNVSAPLLNGTSVAAPSIAVRAQANAKTARSGKTSRKPNKASASGRSS
ncbi:hypothetical protein [Pseudovibrio sp. Tun.PSC04-5.I4]|uniref:hypothetical protein n=1 Tax=Pseudovibrio sp. Tun.PSC04-5.I4 TaxID=1798213 RepID=UPI000882EDDD|nr:hypothetical protein [Pseudovibrio sp. Tun.PSC04-5.I4]SDR39882.1 hypothetical protein SAMN04515695_5361 [Pseudovibrio sp. Tun.PSC04-5.I4]